MNLHHQNTEDEDTTVAGEATETDKQNALVLTFRDLFRSGGMNIILEEMETNRRSNRMQRRNVSSSSNVTICSSEEAHPVVIPPTNIHDQRLISLEQNVANMTCPRLIYQDEATPLLCEESGFIACTEILPSPLPLYSSGLFSSLAFIRRMKKEPENLTVPLNPEDENKTVATLRKVAKWSPRKQNSITFAVSLPADEKHTALAVVENAVNRVKEEQLMRKKKKKFLWLRFC